MLPALLKQRDKAPAPQRNDNPVQTELYGNALFEALVCEFHWSALQIGGITNAINAALKQNKPWVLRSCRNMMPAQAAVINVALKSWSDIALTKSATSAIGRIYFNLADAKIRTETFLDGLGPTNSQAMPAARLQQLAAMWRQISEDCRLAVQELETETRWRLSELYTANALVLAKMLKDAAKGGFACIDPMGNVVLPVLPQRRREVRYSILQQCTLTVRNTPIQAVARDISRTGIGIAGKCDARLRDYAVIELHDGRRFKGRVVWVKDGNLGIQFDEPLGHSDPLIAA